MKITSDPNERGSVLVTALITITILTLICATSLYVASQNTNAGMQTASWQQALSGAESAADLAFNALNNASASGSAWRGWRNVQGSPPSTQPSPGVGSLVIGAGANPTPTPGPSPGYYYYLVSNTTAPPNSTPFPNLTFSTGTEGNNSVSGWMTIDTAGLPLDKNGNQWYRVRATGTAGVPGLKRVSNQRLDDNLRKFSLIFDRKAGVTVSSPVASRTIEVIAAPEPKNVLAYSVVLRNSINMNGNTFIDSFNSNNGPWSLAQRLNHATVATTNSTNSNLHNEALYGSLAYSGPTIAGTGGVTGTISTPFNASPSPAPTPVWTTTPNTYTGAPALAGLLAATGTGWGVNATQVKINGDFITNGGTLTIANGNGSNPAYIEIWVTGQFSTTNALTQSQGVYVKWYVNGNISTGGGSYVNQNTASYTSFIGLGSRQGNPPSETGTVSISGNSNMVAVVNAPGYDVTITGTGDMSGSLTANSLSMIGSGDFHYDEALAPPNSSNSIANYSFASWFEDNSDPGRKDQNGNAILTY
jgi:Tfp pilus assembly protein PilX